MRCSTLARVAARRATAFAAVPRGSFGGWLSWLLNWVSGPRTAKHAFAFCVVPRGRVACPWAWLAQAKHTRDPPRAFCFIAPVLGDKCIFLLPHVAGHALPRLHHRPVTLETFFAYSCRVHAFPSPERVSGRRLLLFALGTLPFFAVLGPQRRPIHGVSSPQAKQQVSPQLRSSLERRRVEGAVNKQTLPVPDTCNRNVYCQGVSGFADLQVCDHSLRTSLSLSGVGSRRKGGCQWELLACHA